MSDAILVLNAGSSSIKFSLFPGHMSPSRQGRHLRRRMRGHRAPRSFHRERPHRSVAGR